ncbi:A24 family peptidase [Halobacterium zhouii]|uniref:A24 family peptidase n=1 Tax=Halobacterium zhouii TaxID=2902624 RepID=UPI001E46E99B|nr:prepilin peptidase [Halobacterium zhouii]
MYASIPDLLRLLAVPALGWAAVRDWKTRRVPNDLWSPLAFLGFALLFWEGLVSLGQPGAFQLYAVRVAFSVLFVVPLAYGFWYVGGFGGADARAFMVLAVLLPTYPYYEVAGYALPQIHTAVGIFSLTVLTNTVLLGLAYPLVLGARNALAGEFSYVMFVGRRVRVPELATTHGSLLEDGDGFTRNGLDLDALRMYLRWRNTSLPELRENPGLRDPDTLPDSPGEPTDGAVIRDDTLTPSGGEPTTDGGHSVTDDASIDTDPGNVDADDPWGAAAFLGDIDGTAYGTTPAKLREGLDAVTEREDVWVTPGVPFLVPLFVGLLVSLTVGDVLYYALDAVGFA